MSNFLSVFLFFFNFVKNVKSCLYHEQFDLVRCWSEFGTPKVLQISIDNFKYLIFEIFDGHLTFLCQRWNHIYLVNCVTYYDFE